MPMYADLGAEIEDRHEWEVLIAPARKYHSPERVHVNCGGIGLTMSREHANNLRDALIEAIGPGERIPDATTQQAAE